ncbi:hypothetical protein FKM82_008211 [Ascaphus truei]
MQGCSMHTISRLQRPLQKMSRDFCSLKSLCTRQPCTIDMLASMSLFLGPIRQLSPISGNKTQTGQKGKTLFLLKSLSQIREILPNKLH